MRPNCSRFPEFLNLWEQRDELRDDLFGGIDFGKGEESFEPWAILAKPPFGPSPFAWSESPTRNQALRPSLGEIQYEPWAPIFFPLHAAFEYDIRIDPTKRVNQGGLLLEHKALVPKNRDKVPFSLRAVQWCGPCTFIRPAAEPKQARRAEMAS